MTIASGGFVRRNAFVVAAVLLPVVVVAFFLLATLIPRWTVPPPAFDLLLRAEGPYSAPPPTVAVEISVRGGQVEVAARPAAAGTYVQRWSLFRFEHATGRVRQIPLDLPAVMAEGEAPRTVVVQELASLRVSAETRAPDGYELQSGVRGRTGFVGDLFGMGRSYRQSASLVNRGRILGLDLPSPYEEVYSGSVHAVGWVVEPER
jgi:hypothetical protein